MKFHLLILALLTPTLLALPNGGNKDDDHHHHCLDTHSAQAIANAYLAIWTGDFSHIDQTVTDTFTYTDDALSFLLQRPSPFFTGKAAFEAGVPKSYTTSFVVLKVYHGCDSVTIRWQQNGKVVVPDPGSTAKPGDAYSYTGTEVLELAKGSHLIQAAYSAANFFKFLFDMGDKVCFQRNPTGPVCA